MPDSQTINTVLNAYGISGLAGAGGGFNWGWWLGNIVFGILGFYFFIQGKKDKSWRAMAIGIALMIYPYFVSNTFLIFAIGIALTAAFYLWRE